METLEESRGTGILGVYSITFEDANEATEDQTECNRMKFLVFALFLLSVAIVSASLFPSDSLDMFAERPWTREHLRALRVRRDWSDPYAQMTGWSIYSWSG
ncbi:hypothetical protein QR680_011151 [Steinernema hermaphroditum]|uniref:Uncharacterized protein n=1 Tax=Steinernema hermaphroditum TaxID=289476 RepID=A0AA39ITS5_9BILA|nr:hypothetical protein QR680_011151 [Steinernema hermaphroditum]